MCPALGTAEIYPLMIVVVVIIVVVVYVVVFVDQYKLRNISTYPIEY